MMLTRLRDFDSRISDFGLIFVLTVVAVAIRNHRCNRLQVDLLQFGTADLQT